MDVDHDSFDAVVIGTGLPNAILAAALARIEKRVLHIDSLEFYGQEWTTFSLAEMRQLDQHFCAPPQTPDGDDEPPPAPPGEKRPVSMVNVRYTYPVLHKDETVCVPAPSPAAVSAPPSSVTAVAMQEGDVAPDDQTPANAGSDGGPAADQGAPEEASVAAASSPSDTPPHDEAPVAQPAVETTAAEEAPPTKTREEREADALEALMKQARRYNIDLLPKACLSKGSLIQLLISSNIGRYLEFKAVAATYIRMGGENREVPCSKQTLLLNRSVSPKEKRLLMKFLHFCTTAVNEESSTDDNDAKSVVTDVPDTGLEAYLKSEWKFSSDLAKYITFAIANVDPDTPAKTALARVREFFSSLGHYGKTPFIYPLYGVGEIPQAFCRLCAVFGGTYMLRQSVDGFATSDTGKACTGIVLNGKHIASPWVVTTAACLPASYPVAAKGTSVVRAVVLTDNTVVPEADPNDPAVTLCIPPGTAGNANNVNAFVLSTGSAACPSGTWLTQLVTKGTEGGTSPRAQLEPLVQALTRQDDNEDEGDTTKPRLLYVLYFSMETERPIADHANTLGGLVVSHQPPLDALNFQDAVAEAKRMFDLICPGEEFLPTAPNPEDIDWGPPQPTEEEVQVRLSALEQDGVVLQQTARELVQRKDAVVARTLALGGNKGESK
eukprot:m.35858 g.35858  ORF g.35858 m.35858 type:complete len:665 (+) comp5336_c0_seq2:190-2184(+)